MLQSKGNRLCYVKLIYDVYAMCSQSWLVRENQTTYKNLFQNGKEAAEIYIWLPYLIYRGTY